ncbi:MAG: VWA domain-containing protein [Nitratireductor sp.]|nr:VWA domain-containing protein [Nitratireductor sp.]
MPKMQRHFLRNEGGNFAITFAICAIPLFLSAGLAVDYSSAYMFRGRLQNAVDTATLAAGKEMTQLNDGQLRKIVRQYVASNLEAADNDYIRKLDIDIDRSKMSLKVTADAKMNASFAPLIGIKTLDYEVVASVKTATGGIEAVLVLDNTGSMAGTRLDQLKLASNTFLDDMFAQNTTSNKVKIGIVPFSEYVNVGTDNRNASWMNVESDSSREVCGETRDVLSKSGCSIENTSWMQDGILQTGTREVCTNITYSEPYQTCWQEETKWNGCAGSRDHPFNLRDANYNKRIPGAMNAWCPSRLTQLTDNRNALKNQIDSMYATGNTYIPAGLMWGLRAISSKAPFTEGTAKNTAAQKNITQAIILMTDGENTLSKDPNSYYHNAHDVDEANQYTLAACDAIKKEDIKIYALTFGDTVPQETKDMIKSCSSGSGYYFDADDGQALKAAFADIAASLNRLYLTQ